MRDKSSEAKPAAESQQDEILVEEIEIEDLAIDGICGVY